MLSIEICYKLHGIRGDFHEEKYCAKTYFLRGEKVNYTLTYTLTQTTNLSFYMFVLLRKVFTSFKYLQKYIPGFVDPACLISHSGYSSCRSGLGIHRCQTLDIHHGTDYVVWEILTLGNQKSVAGFYNMGVSWKGIWRYRDIVELLDCMPF